MANAEQQDKNMQPREVKPPNKWDKFLDSFGVGKRWEKEAAYLESLESAEPTAENESGAEHALDTIESAAANEVSEGTASLEAAAADTATRVEALGVSDAAVTSELANVQADIADMAQPNWFRRTLDRFLHGKDFDAISRDPAALDAATKRVEEQEAIAARKAEAYADKLEQGPSTAKKITVGVGEVFSKALDIPEKIGNLASEVPGIGVNAAWKKEHKRQMQEEALHDQISDTALEKAFLEGSEHFFVGATEPGMPTEEPTEATSAPQPYSETQALFRKNTEAFISDNPYNRTEEEQTKFAGFAAYEAATDERLTAEVDALRQEWAKLDGVGEDYDPKSEQFKLQTGEALRQVMERAETIMQAGSFDELQAALSGMELTSSDGTTVDMNALNTQLSELHGLSLRETVTPHMARILTRGITRSAGLRETVQRLMIETSEQAADADIAGLEGMAETPEVAGLGVEMEAGAERPSEQVTEASTEEPEAEPMGVGLEGLASTDDADEVIGGFGIEIGDDDHDSAPTTQETSTVEAETETVLDTTGAISEALAARTSELLADNPFGRSEDVQAKFAGADVYARIPDGHDIKQQVDALRKSWAQADGIGEDYPDDTESHHLQTGEALRQVLAGSQNQREVTPAMKEVLEELPSEEEVVAAIDEVTDDSTVEGRASIDTQDHNTVDPAVETQEIPVVGDVPTLNADQRETARVRKLRLDLMGEMASWERTAEDSRQEASQIRKSMEDAENPAARKKLEKRLANVERIQRDAEGYVRDMEGALARLDARHGLSTEEDTPAMAA